MTGPLPHLHVVGRFPPPIDGQAIATSRLADVLDKPSGGEFEVLRTDVGAPDGANLVLTPQLRLGRIAHFLKIRDSVHSALAAHPEATVIWPSISPSVLGHLRDRLVVAPAFCTGQRVFGVVHRGDFQRLFESPLTRASGRQLVKRLAGVVFNSAGLADRCAPWIPPEKRAVIPNTLWDGAIASALRVHGRPEPNPSSRPLHLLFLSNMIPSKGYHDVLEAVAILCARGIETRASFVGRWPNDSARTAFDERVRDAGVEDRVDVLGGISDRTRVQEILLDADLFVLPTTYAVEAQPLTVIEALAAGTPVIVTRHASLPEMVREGSGAAFVRAHRPDDIADAAVRLMAEWRYHSQAARARYEAVFSPSAVRDRWTDLLLSSS